MNEEILKYDVNEIHEACENLGHTTNWEYFDKELKTYSEQDKKNLLEELQKKPLII